MILPPPVAATYGDLLETSALVVDDIAAATIRDRLAEVAADAGLAIDPSPIDGSQQARVSVSTGDRSFAPQGYRLDVEPSADGPRVTVRAADEEGVGLGLVSLGQLVVTEGHAAWLRAATVDDAPGFARRGAILDPWILPDTGITAASRATLLERVRLGVRYKLNFVDLPSRKPWPELVRYCTDHHVELMVAWGYGDALLRTPRTELHRQLDELLDAGTRSLSFNFDDLWVSDPEAQAHAHAAVFRDLADHVRRAVPDIRLSGVFPPYGGVPGRSLISAPKGDGERYLATLRTELPEEVRVFWTGDGGVFSRSVTAAGAKAYADAVGHEIGLWDNDTIRFARDRKPVSGRATDLGTVVGTYMGNLAGESNWPGTNGELALLTSLLYAWNPSTYEPLSAADAVEQILARPAGS